MLSIHYSVYQQLEQVFLSDNYEQGFILGSKERFDCIDCCHQIPANQSGIYFYIPDNCAADSTVHRWADKGICFSGFIHSHTKGQKSFSEDDIHFANQLLNCYKCPYLWFGLAVVTADDIEMNFYQIYTRDSQLVLLPAIVEIV